MKSSFPMASRLPMLELVGFVVACIVAAFLMSAPVQAHAVGLTKPSISTVKSKKACTVTVKAKATPNADGYQFKVARNGVAKKKTVAGRTCTFKKLSGGKAYSVKVRAYKKANGKKTWSAWSSAKTVKVKKRSSRVWQNGCFSFSLDNGSARAYFSGSKFIVKGRVEYVEKGSLPEIVFGSPKVANGTHVFRLSKNTIYVDYEEKEVSKKTFVKKLKKPGYPFLTVYMANGYATLVGIQYA